MKVNVLYKLDTSPGMKKSPEVAVWIDTKAELARLRLELNQEKDEWKKRETLRKIARIERFDRIQEWDNPEKEAIGKILLNKTTETYLGSDLLSLKKRWVDISSLVLVSEEAPDKEISSTKMEVGNSFIVNFGVNKHLNANIGAGDILPNEVNTVKINGVEWIRGNIPRPGYYAGEKYLPIFDGDKIEIVKKLTLSGEEAQGAKTSEEKRWAYLRASDMIDFNKKNPLTNLSEDTALFSEVTRVAQEREIITSKLVSASKKEFADKIIPLCKEIWSRNWIPWQVMFWQAALESWWGKSELTANYNNFFWIKSHWWNGGNVTMRTAEDGNTGTYYENASFRIYKTPEDWLQGYVDFLRQNPRYKNAFNHSNDPLAFISELKGAWYATDRNYVAKVQSIWEQYS